MSEPLDLGALHRDVRSLGFELVTREHVADMKKMAGRLSDAERRLRDVAALRLVSERKDWRGWLVRRWIKRTERALTFLEPL